MTKYYLAKAEDIYCPLTMEQIVERLKKDGFVVFSSVNALILEKGIFHDGEDALLEYFQEVDYLKE